MPPTLNASDLKQVEHVKFLSGVGESERDRLLEFSRVRRFALGQSIFQQGDPADAFFIVLSGWAVLYREQLDGERTVIHLFGPGDSLAEALILPDSQYPASAEAASELRVLRVPTARFRKEMEERPQLALSIISARRAKGGGFDPVLYICCPTKKVVNGWMRFLKSVSLYESIASKRLTGARSRGPN